MAATMHGSRAVRHQTGSTFRLHRIRRATKTMQPLSGWDRRVVSRDLKPVVLTTSGCGLRARARSRACRCHRIDLPRRRWSAQSSIDDPAPHNSIGHTLHSRADRNRVVTGERASGYQYSPAVGIRGRFAARNSSQQRTPSSPATPRSHAPMSARTVSR